MIEIVREYIEENSLDPELYLHQSMHACLLNQNLLPGIIGVGLLSYNYSLVNLVYHVLWNNFGTTTKYFVDLYLVGQCTCM